MNYLIIAGDTVEAPIPIRPNELHEPSHVDGFFMLQKTLMMCLGDWGADPNAQKNTLL